MSAEEVGFEPTVPETGTPDFESGAFDHSATFPTRAREAVNGASRSALAEACDYSSTNRYPRETVATRSSTGSEIGVWKGICGVSDGVPWVLEALVSLESSGLVGRSRKPVYRIAVPWVRIPPPPLPMPCSDDSCAASRVPDAAPAFPGPARISPR